jgi:hypothetical protein
MSSTVCVPSLFLTGLGVLGVLQLANSAPCLAAPETVAASRSTDGARAPQPRVGALSGNRDAQVGSPGHVSLFVAASAAPRLGEFRRDSVAGNSLELQPFDRSGRVGPIRATVFQRGVPLQLTLTDQQMWAINMRHQNGSNNFGSSSIDDVVVLVQHQQVPMRDVSQDVWGGLAAPLWAILHPTQSWRIFLPIPPK